MWRVENYTLTWKHASAALQDLCLWGQMESTSEEVMMLFLFRHCCDYANRNQDWDGHFDCQLSLVPFNIASISFGSVAMIRCQHLNSRIKLPILRHCHAQCIGEAFCPHDCRSRMVFQFYGEPVIAAHYLHGLVHCRINTTFCVALETNPFAKNGQCRRRWWVWGSYLIFCSWIGVPVGMWWMQGQGSGHTLSFIRWATNKKMDCISHVKVDEHYCSGECWVVIWISSSMFFNRSQQPR